MSLGISQQSDPSNYLLRNLYDVDEFVLELASIITEGQGFDADRIKTGLKREYFSFKVEKNGSSISYLPDTKEQISEDIYEIYKDFGDAPDTKYATSLNFEEFSTLAPLIEGLTFNPELYKVDLFKFTEIIKTNILNVHDGKSKTMLISKVITDLNNSYILLEELLYDSLIPLNDIQKTVIKRHLYFDKEAFRLLILEYSPFFTDLLKDFSYGNKVFDEIAKNHIKEDITNRVNPKGYRINKKSSTNYRQAFDLLKKYQFFKENTNYSDFQNVFSTLEEREIERQIKWKDKKNALQYFIKTLKVENIIDENIYRKTVWQVAESVFRHYDVETGKETQLKDLKNNRATLPSDKKKKLEEIIRCF